MLIYAFYYLSQGNRLLMILGNTFEKMMIRLCIVVLNFSFAFSNLFANNQELYWDPSEHPAIVEHEIVAFTEPAHHLNLAAEFSGRVNSVLVEKGSIIAGASGTWAPVVILDSKFATIARNRAQVAKDLAQLQYQQAQNDLALAQRQQEHYLAEVRRIESLASKGKVRKTDLDAAIFDADQSKIGVERAEVSLIFAEQSLKDASYQLDDAEERLARHVIKAPAGWVVTNRGVEPGAFIQRGLSLLNLVDTTELAIKLRLSEEEISAIPAGTGVNVDFVRQEFPSVSARIHHINVDHDPITNKRLVELRIPGTSAPFATGGLEVIIKLFVKDRNGLVFIPHNFLTLRLEQYFIKLKEGREFSVIPLRRQGDFVLISQEQLPDNAVLVRNE